MQKFDMLKILYSVGFQALKKNQCDVFDKPNKEYFFSSDQIFAYVPPSAIHGNQLRTFDYKFFLLNLPYRQDNYIYLVKNIIIIDLLILGMDFFQHSGHNMMPIYCNAS